MTTFTKRLCSKFTFLAFITSCLTTVVHAQFLYPVTRTVDSSDTYFGKTYPDRYRWLENIKSPEVEKWFKDQATYTNAQMNSLNGRDQLIAEWKTLDKLKSATFTDITIKNGQIFYRKTLPGESVGKLYYKQGITAKEVLLFDPLNHIKGQKLSMQEFVPSFDGKLVAIAYSKQGAEVGTICILDVVTNTFLPETIYPTRGFGSWTFDNKAILYSKLKSDDAKDPSAFLNSKIMLHTVSQKGKSSVADLDFFSNASNPELHITPGAYPQAFYTASSPNYVFGGSSTVEPDFTLFYAPIVKKGSTFTWKVLSTPADSLVNGIEYKGNDVYAISHDNASNFKLVSTSLLHPDWKHAKLIIAEKKELILKRLTSSKNFLFLTYSDGINCAVYKYNLHTKLLSAVKVPLAGNIEVSCIDEKSDMTLISVFSWNKPFTEFAYNPVSESFVASSFNKKTVYPARYLDIQVKEVLVKAADGAMIPLSIMYKKGTVLDGSNVCLLEGYGAYGITLDPYFSILTSALVTKGAVFAVAHVRGGGEKGQSWYKGGYKTTKPNTWKDFNACAMYLIDQKYTVPAKLGGWGTSAGGILISRAITERPDLYAAALCNVGCANALRLEFSANGPVNIPEFGTVKNETECKALYEMDGFQHIVAGTRYPAILSIGGWNDPRVAPWQPAKFAAAMQTASTSGKPVLIKINYDNGHFTEDKNVTFANFADQFSFIMWQCGHPDFQPKKNVL